MPNRFPHLRAAIVRHPWAMTPDALEAMVELIERRADGILRSRQELDEIRLDRAWNGVATLFSAEDLSPVSAASISAAAGDGASSRQVIAVLNIMGVIAQHAGEVDDICGPGGTSTERVASNLRQALADPSVVAIVLNIDSPGGNVHGVQALADEIFKARGQKAIIAQVNSTAASAAYWIAASADEIVVTPGGEVGSIGVYALHRDVSKAAEAQGVKFTFISAGKYKVEGNPYEPLSEETVAALQQTIDSYYSDFTKAVARGRGVGVSDVVNGFGEGRTVKDYAAVKAGMADRVATLDDTLRRAASKKPSQGARADADIATTVVAEVSAPATETLAADPAAGGALTETDAAAHAEPVGEPVSEGDGTSTTESRDAFRRRRHAARVRSLSLAIED